LPQTLQKPKDIVDSNFGSPSPQILTNGIQNAIILLNKLPPSDVFRTLQFDKGIFMKMNADAEAVLKSAKIKARKLQHNYVGTEHLLHGILLRRNSAAMVLLKNVGLKHKDVLRCLEEQVSPGSHAPAKGEEFTLTPRVKKILSLAEREADSRGVAEIGSEHILLAAMIEGNGVLPLIVRHLGVDLQEVRDALAAPAQV
jgi:ATP-dependent Clp protease ATP-binding subunit ClpA